MACPNPTKKIEEKKSGPSLIPPNAFSASKCMAPLMMSHNMVPITAIHMNTEILPICLILRYSKPNMSNTTVPEITFCDIGSTGIK